MSAISENLLSFRHSVWLPRLVSIVLLGLMSWWLVITVLPMFEQPATLAEKIKPTPVVKQETQSDISQLHLFGVAGQQEAQDKITEVKETQLKLTLRGILATDDPSKGLAQIQNDGKEEKYFQVEDDVFGLATLKEIYQDRVIILRNGARETLLLPEEFLNNKHYQAARLKQQQKKVASDYRNLLIQNDGMELIKLFGFKTKFRNGAFQGFVVKALGDRGREMMEVLGIQDGDLIVEVNGLRFSKSLEATAQLKDLKTATSIHAIIDRDGQEIPFSLELDAPISKYGDIPEGKTEQDVIRERALSAPSFHETQEFQEYKTKQQDRSTGQRLEVEFDH